jgi:hypothetical protein
MEPISASMGIEVAVGVLGAIAKSRQHLIRLLDAVRGAEHKKSVWYALCHDLGEGCKVILPLLENLEAEMRQSKSRTKEAVEDVLEVLSSALSESADLVLQCQSASTATLFFRGETMKEKFRKVAERIAQCLRSLPLAAFHSTLELQRDVRSVVQSLESARCARGALRDPSWAALWC